MKKLITENGDYRVYAVVDTAGAVDGKTYLKFLTEYTGARVAEQHEKFIMFLNKDERKALKDLL